MAKANTSSYLALKYISIILLVQLIVFYIFWDQLPSQDPEQYFQFADQRRIFGLTHFWDVFSNVLLLYASLYGFLIFVRNYHRYDTALWECFFVLNLSVFFTCWGSSYFHLLPSAERLIWDRLPMAVGFAALVGFIFADRVTTKYHRILLTTLIGLAVFSVISIQHGAQDLRYYIMTQYGALGACLLLLLFRPHGRLSTKIIFLSFFLYALAKVFEYYDHSIYTVFVWSGHTWKHVFAAASIFTLNYAASLAHLKIKTQEPL